MSKKIFNITVLCWVLYSSSIAGLFHRYDYLNVHINTNNKNTDCSADSPRLSYMLQGVPVHDTDGKHGMLPKQQELSDAP
jgi:hypothetical protein